MINPKKQRKSLTWMPALWRGTETDWPMWWLTFHRGTSASFWPCRSVSYSSCHGWNLAVDLRSMLWAGLCALFADGWVDTSHVFLFRSSTTWRRLVQSSPSLCFWLKVFVCSMTVWSRANSSTLYSLSVACAPCCRSPSVSGRYTWANQLFSATGWKGNVQNDASVRCN